MPDFSPELLAYGFVWYVAFLFSTTCHEAAHALVAKLGGDETAALGGQVTLNPVPHIQREPWGMVVIPILSFIFTQGMIGWASAPFDPSWQRRHPRRTFRGVGGDERLQERLINFDLEAGADVVFELLGFAGSNDHAADGWPTEQPRDRDARGA